ncbi:hypothetical protein FXN61_00330 [Lentzea sp. PSKA42]|uniref:Helix-turn-helix domain-containing protein n=1 Tax=Lentzea indica TaxID=2604800 RepID=A0ABX1F8W2_9PSEU|nr:hypothetical protein [Lentzea indica]NKE55353.1 hypothetical protein [Lentzea indica]
MNDREVNLDGYVYAVSLARRHGVSMSTVRRRIKEGVLFPGARKLATAAGEQWMIPQAEAWNVKIDRISPRAHHRRLSAKELNAGEIAEKGNASADLESRIIELERLAERLLAEGADKEPVL